MRRPNKKSLGEIPLEEAHGGSGNRQVILSKEDDVSEHFHAMTKGFLNPGSSFEWHHHDNIDEFFVVLKGVGKVLYKDENGETQLYSYKSGDVFYMPAGIPHEIRCSGSETSEYFFVRLDA